MSRSYNLAQIINELITTEQSYVHDLKDISQVYLPCFSILNNISGEDVDTVFNNIESILHISQSLLHDLLAADSNLVKIAECFLDRASDFHQYSSYCTGYHRANERVLELKQKNPFLATILNDLQRSLGHSLPLTCYLHKPVQRILKYHLILKNLLKYVEESSDAVPSLLEAYESMANCAEDINNCKRLTEMDVKTRELHELLLAIRETQHFGKLIREGEMTLERGGSSPKASQMMFMYLFENVLVLCHKVNDVFALHTILRCSELLMLEQNTRKELEFTLVPFSAPSHCITLKAKTLAQKLDWCIQLERLTEHNIPSKAKELLLSKTKFNLENATPTNQTKKLSKRSLTVTSPTSLGRSVKRRLRSSVNGILTKSRSVINLRRSSSTSGGSSSLQQSCDSAFDSMSLKSDVSCSSDRLSSLSSQVCGDSVSSPRSDSHHQSHDDSSDYARSLYDNISLGNVSHWHPLLCSRIHKFRKRSVDILELPECFQNSMRRSKSCMELTNLAKCGDVKSVCSSPHTNFKCGLEKASKSSNHRTSGRYASMRNLLEVKGYFLHKVLRWQRRADKTRSSAAAQESVAPSADPVTIKQRQYESTPVWSYDTSYNCDSESSVYSYEDLKEDAEECDESDDCVFKLNISDNFSDSLIESFNNVLLSTSVI